MEDKYIIQRCNVCKRSFILDIQEAQEAESKGTYLTCPYDGRHGSVSKEGKFAGIKECMNHLAYKRIKGSVKQIRY